MSDGIARDQYAVIGNPVAHSLSPRIHAMFAAETAQAISYGTLTAPLDGFAAAAGEFFDGGGRGLNVTVPFKQDAWRWVTRHDAAAAASGAVNTIVPEDDAFRGCNTDGIGLVRDLSENLGWTLAGARVLLLGAGGAARGVLPALREAGPAEITLANRTESRALEVAARFDGLRACSLADMGEGWDIVLNATSASMGGPALGAGTVETTETKEGAGDLSQFSRSENLPERAEGVLALPNTCVAGAACYDLFYNLGAPTPFCAWADQHGARVCADGLGMLIEQAAEAFRLWRGVPPATRKVREALRKADP
ncbi:MAG: shikimate dehydrogenase [Gammaproteobacteria bacterium]|nr:shikimate dehydrogenase [Gammaproteobacteria bacterium]MYB37863.1 shikimate dehydrogenase [Gammaproteobacteria bacterium]